ncbi:MAG: SH3 domain-containing protein [Candidatus Dojkabacteria bacterium]|nr:MAG: SH3 domain-containing protein [Candidatus Dojkabacteria bacterium]
MKILTKIVNILLVVAAFVVVVPQVPGYQAVKREDLGFDEGLSSKDAALYAFPGKILITQVEAPNTAMESDPESWIDLLYYYYITRLGFGDLPYTYLVDKSGTVYEGRSNYEGVVPELLDAEGAVLIGYLSNGADVTSAAADSINELVEEVSYKYGITRENVEAVDLEVSQQTAEGELSKLEYKSTDSMFADELDQILSKVTYSDRENLSFKAAVSEVSFEEKVPIGGKLTVKFKLKNDGDTPWFTLNDFVYVVTSSNEDSQFAVNGEWDSFDTPTHVEGKTVLPGESVDIEFQMAANTMPGEYSESFKFSRTGGKDLQGGEFEVKFTIEQGDVQLIEITETETGNLNVRKDPNLGAQVVGQVDSGAIFVVKESQNNWYKIEYEPGADGWVIGRYIKRL